MLKPADPTQELYFDKVRKIGYWESQLKRPINKRMNLDDQALTDHVVKAYALSSEPSSILNIRTPSDEDKIKQFESKLKLTLEELGPQFKKILEQKIVSFVPMENVNSSGMILDIPSRDKNGDPVYHGIVVMNIDHFLMPTNQWASLRLESQYIGKDGKHLEISLNEPSKIESKNLPNSISDIDGARYQLLRQIGLVITMGTHLVPLKQKLNGIDKNFDSDQSWFAKLSWKTENGRTHSRFKNILSPKLLANIGKNIASIETLYEKLEMTNFPTLAATKSVSEDFAESFANYVHTQILKKPYQIKILNNETIIAQYSDCWGQDRCLDKKTAIEKFMY